MIRAIAIALLFLVPGLASAQTHTPIPWTPPSLQELQCPGGVCPIPPNYRPQPGQQPQPSPSQQPANIPANIVAASVRIGFAPQGGKAKGGSGVVFGNADGISYIVTNKHVAPNGNATITAYFPDGSNAVCKWVSADTSADLACLTVARNVSAVAVSATPADVGESILQCGYPHGIGPSKKRGTSKGFCGVLDDNGAKLGSAALGVDPGDSGSGLFRTKDSTLCGIVCRRDACGTTAIYVPHADVKRFTESCLVQVTPKPKPWPDPGAQPPTDTRPPWADAIIRDGNEMKALVAILLVKIDALAVKAAIPGPSGPPGPIGGVGNPGAAGATGPVGPAGKDGRPGKDAPDLTAQLTELAVIIAAMKVEISKVKAMPGAQGEPGPAGKDGQGIAGKDGTPGKDGQPGKSADTAALLVMIETLKSELVILREQVAAIPGSVPEVRVIVEKKK